MPGPEAKELIAHNQQEGEARPTTFQCEGGRTSSRENLGAKSCCLFASLFCILQIGHTATPLGSSAARQIPSFLCAGLQTRQLLKIGS